MSLYKLSLEFASNTFPRITTIEKKTYKYEDLGKPQVAPTTYDFQYHLQIQRAASLAGSRNGSLAGGNSNGLLNGHFQSPSTLTPSMSTQPPLPQVPSPETDAMRWGKGLNPNYSDKSKQNVYAVSTN